MLKKLLTNVGRKILFSGYYLYSLVWIPVDYYVSHSFGELRYLSDADYRAWKRAMQAMVKEYCREAYNIRIRQVVQTFANSKIEVIRKREVPASEGPIVVLCVKNDLQRIQMLVRHYRERGVTHFAFLDNCSTDGTFEWLKEQEDIDLFRTAEHYQTMVKEGWINRIVSHYGLDRWYILTDSDELLCYIGMEEYPLQDVLRYAEEKGIRRFKALSLDMYTNGALFGETGDIRKEYCWMDTDSYYPRDVSVVRTKMKDYYGGPRWRVMGSDVTLTKFPLVFFAKGTVSASAHYQYPYEDYRDTPINMAILHYKFIDKDLEEYRRRADASSGFARGGVHYKHYLEMVEENGEVSFLYDGSVKFEDSNSLRRISEIREIPLVRANAKMKGVSDVEAAIE